jgi:7-cyano-7-deazaguanine synthase
MNKAVVLLSGGLDSTTVMAIAKSEGYDICALSFDYGQRHKNELELARINADRFGAKKHLVMDFSLKEMGGSALTSDIEIPKESDALSVTGDELKDNKTVTHHTSRVTNIPVTYVPARNTIFLSFALAWAETLGTGDIFIGANAVDYSGYPDCRPEYIKAFEDMSNLAVKAAVEGKIRFTVHAPLINLTKAEIIKKGIALGVDYSLTWSCYDPVTDSSPDSVSTVKRGRRRLKPCMQCDSCLLRTRGFKEAGVKDPLTLP